MSTKRNTSRPDFSFIRSATQRADAERSYEIGCDIADAVIDVSAIVSRALDRVARTVSRKPITDW